MGYMYGSVILKSPRIMLEWFFMRFQAQMPLPFDMTWPKWYDIAYMI